MNRKRSISKEIDALEKDRWAAIFSKMDIPNNFDAVKHTYEELFINLCFLFFFLFEWFMEIQ